MGKNLKLIVAIFICLIISIEVTASDFVVGVPPGILENAPITARFIKDCYKRIGVNVNFLEFPFYRLNMLLNENKIDADFLRQDFINLKGYKVDPSLGEMTLFAYYYKDNIKIKQSVKLEDLKELIKFRVSYVKGTANKEIFSNFKNYIEASSVNQMVDLIKSDRIDIFVTSANLCQKISNVECAPIKKVKLKHVLSQQHQSLQFKLSKTFKELLTPKKYLEISKEIQSAVTKASLSVKNTN